MAVFRTDANYIFSDSPSHTHTLSLSVSLAASLFPLLSVRVQNDVDAQLEIISYLTINVCGPKTKLSHFGTLLTI